MSVLGSSKAERNVLSQHTLCLFFFPFLGLSSNDFATIQWSGFDTVAGRM